MPLMNIQSDWASCGLCINYVDPLIYILFYYSQISEVEQEKLDRFIYCIKKSVVPK